jgi:hypothetical protein
MYTLRDAVGQEHEMLVPRRAVPDLKSDTLQVAGLQIEAFRDGEVDPDRRIAAQRGFDRAARHRARLLEQRRGEVIGAGTDLQGVVATLTRIGVDLIDHVGPRSIRP